MKVSNETKRYLVILATFIVAFCSFAMFGGALNWASSQGEPFYWVASFIAIIGLGIGFGVCIADILKRLKE